MNDQIYPDVLGPAVLSENRKLGSKRPRVIKKLMKPSPLKLQTNTGSLTTQPLNQETKVDFQASIDTALKLIKEAKTILDALVDEKKALSNDSCHTPVCTSSANSDQIKSLKWSLSEKIWPPYWVEEPKESIFSSLNKSPTLTYIHSGPICATKNSIPNSTQSHDTLPPTHMDSQSNSCSEAAQSKLYKNYCEIDKVTSNLQPVASNETTKNGDNPIKGQKMNKLLLKLKIWAQENDKKTMAEVKTQESTTLNHQPPTDKTVYQEEKPKSTPLPPSTPSSKQTSSSPVSNNKVPLPVEQKSNSFSTKSSPNKTNHKHNNTSNSSTTRKKKDKSMFMNCYNCGGPHSFRKCPQPKKHKFCYSCGWPDVLSSECPFCNGKLVRPGATESVRKGGDRCRKF